MARHPLLCPILGSILIGMIMHLPMPSRAQSYSLRFNGYVANDQGRVKIPLDAPHRPVDVGGDFTVEFWMKAEPGLNLSNACNANQDWFYGNIIVDRDIFDAGDHGDYGIALANGQIMFGVERLSQGPTTLCGGGGVDDGQWHHIAVTRNASNGALRIFIDGTSVAHQTSTTHTGDLSYRDGRSTMYPNSDPFLVLGAEKHDYQGSLYYFGWLDELRISSSIRYSGNFTPPSEPFTVDGNTAALYHFDEGSGNTIGDATGGSPGFRNPGGNPQVPEWSTDSPFTPLPLSLLDFRVWPIAGMGNRVSWRTAQEVDVSRFEVQRSEDARVWQTLGSVPALNGLQPQDYHWDDGMPPGRGAYYRLRMVDLDGSFTYSPLRFADGGAALWALTVWPNPASGQARVALPPGSEVLEVALINLQGQRIPLVWSMQGAGLEVDLSAIRAGVYNLMLRTSAGAGTARITVP